MQVPHCGYCQNGMMIQAADLLATTKRPDRGADPHRDERPSVPLRHVSADPDRDPEGRGCDGEGWEVTMTEMLNKEFSRKSFVKGGGAMIVGFSLVGAAAAGKASAAAPTPDGYNPSLTKLDSWLRINADNTVNVLTSQGDLGQRHLDRLPDGRRRGARRRDEPDDQRHLDATERPGAQHRQRRLGRRPDRRHRRLELDVAHRPSHPRGGRGRTRGAAQARLDEAGRPGREPDRRARASSRAAARPSPTASSSAASSSTST